MFLYRNCDNINKYLYAIINDLSYFYIGPTATSLWYLCLLDEE